MSDTLETREQVLAWLQQLLQSESLRAGLDAMTTSDLRRYKVELQAELAEMEHDRLGAMSQVPMA